MAPSIIENMDLCLSSRIFSVSSFLGLISMSGSTRQSPRSLPALACVEDWLLFLSCLSKVWLPGVSWRVVSGYWDMKMLLLSGRDLDLSLIHI